MKLFKDRTEEELKELEEIEYPKYTQSGEDGCHYYKAISPTKVICITDLNSHKNLIEHFTWGDHAFQEGYIEITERDFMTAYLRVSNRIAKIILDEN